MSSDGKQKEMAPVGSREQKNGRGHITAFYIEALVLTVIFVMVILALLRVFSVSVHLSREAQDLTTAVRLAENAAEAVAASDSAESLASLLDENGNVTIREDGCVCAEYDREMNPVSGGEIQVEVTWDPGEDGCVNSVITVSRLGNSQTLYILSTAVYIEEAVP